MTGNVSPSLREELHMQTGREIERLGESNRREGEKEGGRGERDINRVAVPPSSQSEAESYYCSSSSSSTLCCGGCLGTSS